MTGFFLAQNIKSSRSLVEHCYPLKGQAEDRAKAKGEAGKRAGEVQQDLSEEEAHEDRDYSEARELSRYGAT